MTAFGEVDDSRLVVADGLVTKTGASDNASYGQVNVGTAATLIRAANASRSSCLVQNLGTQDVYVGKDNAVVVGTGIKVAPGGSMRVTFADAIYGIIAGGTTEDVRYIDESN